MDTAKATAYVRGLKEIAELEFNKNNPFKFTGEPSQFPFAMEIHKRMMAEYATAYIQGVMITDLTLK